MSTFIVDPRVEHARDVLSAADGSDPTRVLAIVGEILDGPGSVLDLPAVLRKMTPDQQDGLIRDLRTTDRGHELARRVCAAWIHASREGISLTSEIYKILAVHGFRGGGGK